MALGFLKRLFQRDRPLTYEESRELAAHKDAAVRAQLAARGDLRPEVLYYLAQDPVAEVRRRVAANSASPPQANIKLATDKDEAVRCDLAGKIARLAPGLSGREHDRLRQSTYQALELLAQDQIPKIRQILAETLKDVANAPPEVIRRLARDAEIAVAAPVLQYSPVLSDDDLLDIIRGSPIPGALSAISQRRVVTFSVADAIASSDDIDAIAVLLGNPSAQIREETLDRLVDRAADIEAWHAPLAERPRLSAKTAQKLARFVATSLLEALAKRNDLDPEAARAVAVVVRKRLDEMAAVGPAKAEAKRAADEAAALARARNLRAAGQLDETTIDTALAGGDHAFVVAGLAVLAGLPVPVVRKAVETQSAKGIIAVAWKAGLSVPLASQLQGKLLHLTSGRLIRAAGGDFPLTREEMAWQIDFLQGR
ncbi:MAG: DUF2336 domain-containing protein [Magnetospirillum sp.]|nr:DUF2336 domain-containing protein [Magnetospirillum sp.]